MAPSVILSRAVPLLPTVERPPVAFVPRATGDAQVPNFHHRVSPIASPAVPASAFSGILI
jgi:hypothetical protein